MSGLPLTLMTAASTLSIGPMSCTPCGEKTAVRTIVDIAADPGGHRVGVIELVIERHREDPDMIVIPHDGRTSLTFGADQLLTFSRKLAATEITRQQVCVCTHGRVGGRECPVAVPVHTARCGIDFVTELPLERIEKCRIGRTHDAGLDE